MTPSGDAQGSTSAPPNGRFTFGRRIAAFVGAIIFLTAGAHAFASELGLSEEEPVTAGGYDYYGTTTTTAPTTTTTESTTTTTAPTTTTTGSSTTSGPATTDPDTTTTESDAGPSAVGRDPDGDGSRGLLATTGARFTLTLVVVALILIGAGLVLRGFPAEEP